MRISVVVRAHNERANIGAALESLSNQQDVNDDDFEIILVDNASSDGTRQIAEQVVKKNTNNSIPFRIVDEPIISRGKALNTGFEAATADWVASLDGDSIADQKWLYSVLRHIDSNPDMVAASGHLEFKEGPFIHRFLYPRFRTSWFTYFSRQGIGYISGANFWMKKKTFKDIGGSHQFEGKYDDKYLAIKLRKLVQETQGRYQIGFSKEAVVRTENWLLNSGYGRLPELRWATQLPMELRESQVFQGLWILLKADASRMISKTPVKKI